MSICDGTPYCDADTWTSSTHAWQPAAVVGHNPVGARYILLALALTAGAPLVRARVPDSSPLTGTDVLHLLLASAVLALRAAFISMRARPEERAD